MAVISRQIDNFLVQVTVGTHAFVGDEPLELGGTDLGPNPFALLMASLGNWTVVTLTGVSREHSIPLERVEVEVDHKQNRIVGGPNDPKQRELRIVRLHRVIRVWGKLTEQQRDKLLWGAQHCPVSNTLEGSVKLTEEIHDMGPVVVRTVLEGSAEATHES